MSLKISVITVCYQASSTISETIRSVNCQSYDNVEHVFVDGGSTDGTLELINSLAEKPFLVKSGPDNGIYDALNKGLSMASGDVVGFLHADDFFTTNDVLDVIAEQFTDPATEGVYSDLIYVDRQSGKRILRYWKCKNFSRGRLVRGWAPPHETLYVRRTWYKDVGEFDTNFKISADYLSIRNLFQQENFARNTHYIPRVLVAMRVGGVSTGSLTGILKKIREDYRVIGQTEGHRWLTLSMKNLRKIRQLSLSSVYKP